MSDPYITALAATVNDMFADGINDPSADQIAHHYFGPDKYIPRSLIEDVRSRLGNIRNALADDGHLTCPLSETYYRRFRNGKKITGTDDAVLCLATGRAKKQVGILRIVETAVNSDLIWASWHQLQLRQGAGKTRRSAEDVMTAIRRELIPMTAGHGLLAETRELAGLEQPDLFSQEIPQLPE